MNYVAGYDFLEQVYEGTRNAAYRSLRASDGASVIIKICKEEHPSRSLLARIRREYEIGQLIQSDYVVKPLALEPCGNGMAIVFEDFGGVSLGKILKDHRLSPEAFLAIARRAARALRAVHDAGVLHKDVKPDNIVVNFSTGRVKLADFGISEAVGREQRVSSASSRFEGSLAYMAPEQSGRMNRSVDFRSDLYSLGAAFYEMLTGRTPFADAADELALIHAHIAIKPIPPIEADAAIDPMLSAIVTKLLCKNAEDRYQTSAGLCSDLDRCAHSLKTTGRIEVFRLAERDVSDRFSLRPKLYGRDVEYAVLADAFLSAVERPARIAVVHGPAGVGKSRLVGELQKLVLEKGGFSGAGQFDSVTPDRPLAGLILAFQDFLAQMMAEPEAVVNAFRLRLMKALGDSARVLTDVFPGLERIIGPQGPVEELAPAEAENRFVNLFIEFIKSCTFPDRTLVIFLDDSHRADRASLRIVERAISGGEVQNAFFILAIRSAEVHSNGALLKMLQALKDQSKPPIEIFPGPLPESAVREMVADSFSLKNQDASKLSAILMHKTNGNPFFVNEFLTSIYEQGALEFDADSLSWRMRIDQIQSAGITDNVAALMSEKLRSLPEVSQKSLQAAACIGPVFELPMLSAILNLTPEAALTALRRPIQEGLLTSAVLTASDRPSTLASAPEENLRSAFRFAHDRVQRAAYDSLTPEDRARHHGAIARTLLTELAPTEAAERVIEIAGHLNEAAVFSRPQSAEKKRALELNLAAAHKARMATAYEPAAGFIEAALALIKESDWTDHYELVRDICTAGAGLYFLCDQAEQAEALGDKVLRHAQSALDRARIYRERIPAYTGREEYGRALDEATFPVLRELGLNLPSHPLKLQIPLHLVRTRIAQGFRSTRALVATPDSQNKHALAAQEIMAQSVTAALFGRPDAYPIIILAQVRLGHQYGASPEYAMFLSVIGLVYIGILGNINAGTEYAIAGMKLIERYPASKAIRAKLSFVLGYFIFPYTRPYEESQTFIYESYGLAHAAGDYEYMVYSRTVHTMVEFLRGRTPLGDLAVRARQQDAEAVRLRQQNARGYFTSLAQLILNLSGEGEKPQELRGEIFDWTRDLPELERRKNMTGILHAFIVQSYAALLFGDYREAERKADLAMRYVEANPAGQYLTLLAFVQAVSLLALAAKAPWRERLRRLRSARKPIARIKEWARHCDENYGTFHRIVQAEAARAARNDEEAGALYDAAIQHARDMGFVNLEALASERAGELYLELGREKIARTYIEQAGYAWSRWGAVAKVHDVGARFRNYSKKGEPVHSAPGAASASGARDASIPGPIARGPLPDVETLTRAVQRLSGEIQLDQLLGAVVELALLHGGGERAALIMQKNEQLFVAARAVAAGPEIRQLSHRDLEVSDCVAIEIVRQAFEKGETARFDNAADSDELRSSAYIQTNTPRSLVCTPLIFRGRTLGALHVEDRTAVGLYDEARAETLRILAAQAAISMENVRLIAEETERQKYQKEMEVARQVQMSILPTPGADAHYELAMHMSPAEQAGGDYYDYYSVNNRRWIAVGDVTGHGMNSGLMMLMAQTGLSTYLNSARSPDILQAFQAINRTLYVNMMERTGLDLYMTCAILSADEDGNFEHAGKHEDILIYRQAAGKVEIEKTEGFWIGLTPDVSPLLSRSVFRLNPGDFITLFTDGVIEARNAAGEQFDTGRLIAVIEKHAPKGIECVKNEILQACFAWMEKQEDDLTVFLMQRK